MAEMLAIWDRRMKILASPPSLFRSITQVETKGKKPVSWDTAMSARLVARENGLIAVATGSGPTYEILKQGTNLLGALSGLFKAMWEKPPLSEIVKSPKKFMLVANSIKAVYDHTARQANIRPRMLISQEKTHAYIRHDRGDSANFLLLQPEAASTLPEAKRQRTQPPKRGQMPSRSVLREVEAKAASSSVKPKEQDQALPRPGGDWWSWWEQNQGSWSHADWSCKNTDRRGNW